MKNKVMQKDVRKVQTVCLPKGCFEGNCRDCRYANWNDTRSDGSVYCDGGYGGYNKPENRNGCFHYVKR